MQSAVPLHDACLDEVLRWLENEQQFADWRLSVENEEGGTVTRLAFVPAGSAEAGAAVRLTLLESEDSVDCVIDFVPAASVFDPDRRPADDVAHNDSEPSPSPRVYPR